MNNFDDFRRAMISIKSKMDAEMTAEAAVNTITDEKLDELILLLTQRLAYIRDLLRKTNHTLDSKAFSRAITIDLLRDFNYTIGRMMSALVHENIITVRDFEKLNKLVVEK